MSRWLFQLSYGPSLASLPKEVSHCKKAHGVCQEERIFCEILKSPNPEKAPINSKINAFAPLSFTLMKYMELFAGILPGMLDLPNIHPVFVHFPIALLCGFLLLEFIGSVTDKKCARGAARAAVGTETKS